MERDGPLPPPDADAAGEHVKRSSKRLDEQLALPRAAPLGRTRGALIRLRSEQPTRVRVQPNDVKNWDIKRLQDYADSLAADKLLNERETFEIQRLNRRIVNRKSAKASRDRRKAAAFSVNAENIGLRRRLEIARSGIGDLEEEIRTLRRLVTELGGSPPPRDLFQREAGAVDDGSEENEDQQENPEQPVSGECEEEPVF